MLGTVPYDDELGTSVANFIDPVAQLRDLLSAEQSAEMANEYQNDRAVLPVITQLAMNADRIDEFEAGKPV